jgi:exonuclease III
VTRDTIQLTNISKIPSGRAISADYGTTHIINLYAPSGTAKRTERENFYNNDLIYLLRDVPEDLIIGGDFNCVLESQDSTGHANYSRALTTLIQGYALNDAWQIHSNPRAYTHYTATCASRLDRFYITRKLMQNKQKNRNNSCGLH